jgi:hypothetical protein
MPGYERLDEETMGDAKKENAIDEEHVIGNSGAQCVPIDSEDPTFANQLILDEEPSIGIYEPNDRRYLLFCFLGIFGFKSCIAWKSAKTYFKQDINSPGLRFMVTGLSIVLSRFIVMCVHWSEVHRFPVELFLPDIFSYPIIFHEYYNHHKMRTIEFFSFVELLCEIALLLQLFNLRRRFTMLAQKGVKVANDFWMDLMLILFCPSCSLAQLMRHMELRKSTEPRLQVETV